MLMHGAVKNAANLSNFYTFSIIKLNGINTYMYKHWFLHALTRLGPLWSEAHSAKCMQG